MPLRPQPARFSKTLFCPAPGTKAMLVVRRGRYRYKTAMDFADAHAALAWAIANDAAFIYFPAGPEQN